jgi:hypothetical protein
MSNTCQMKSNILVEYVRGHDQVSCQTHSIAPMTSFFVSSNELSFHGSKIQMLDQFGYYLFIYVIQHFIVNNPYENTQQSSVTR